MLRADPSQLPRVDLLLWQDLDALVTYDDRLASAAGHLELPVATPGSETG